MNTELLIAQLTQQARPVRRVSFARVCKQAAFVTFGSLWLICSLYGLRPDISERLGETVFFFEIFLNVLLIGAAGWMAALCAFPDSRRQARLLLPLLGLVIAGYSLMAGIALMREPASLAESLDTRPHGIECLLCILSFAAVPGVWLYLRVKFLATTQPRLAAAATLLMAAATGALGVRLVESEISSAGLLLWHYLPVFATSLVGYTTGKKIFHW
ncbi:MAG: DUF1109 domain-containing protein [Proteobacteria bacterium]|nr:DUF1109 domain-containing protein [Pseudomonadota bacterium]